MSLVKLATVSRILKLQLLIGGLGFVGLTLLGRIDDAFSLLYGVLLMVVNAFWLARRLDRTQGMDIDTGRRSIYTGAVLRFIALIAALVLAHKLGMHLLVVAAGMFVAQMIVFVAAARDLRKDKGEGLG